MNFVNVSSNGAGIVENSIPSNKLNPESSYKNLLLSPFANNCPSYSNYHEVAMKQRNSSSTSTPKALRNTSDPTNEIKVENVTINCSSHPQEAISQTSIVPHATMAATERTLQLSQVPIPYYSLLSSIETSSVKIEKGKKKSKSYSCHYCGHRSSQKQSLTQHVQSVHERLKPFECKWESCNYSCSTKQNLDKHVQGVHKKLKPNTCPFCDSSFSQKVTLDNHIRGVHTKVKPFQCQFCAYKAAYRGNLNFHIKSVHEKHKPYSCPAQCGYSCTLKSGLKRHKCS